MLPDIIDIAADYQLNLQRRGTSVREVRAKCPFCQEDAKPGKHRHFYLSLNRHDQVFRCWFCGEQGGVFRFIALLEGIPEQEVTARYRRRKLLHPAERLTRTQRKLLGEAYCYVSEPDWEHMRKRDKAYYLRTLDRLWNDWNGFAETERQEAYGLLLTGILTGTYRTAVELIRKRETETGLSLLVEALNLYSSPERPAWTERAEAFVREGLKKAD